MNKNPVNENNLSVIIMDTMNQGFQAVAKELDKQASKISDLEKELKINTKASYEAHTKEGKDRFLAKLNEQGKSPEEIATVLDIKTVSYVKKRIRNSKKNGR